MPYPLFNGKFFNQISRSRRGLAAIVSPFNEKVAGSNPPGNFNFPFFLFRMSMGIVLYKREKCSSTVTNTPRGAGSSGAVSGDSDREFESRLVH